MPYGPNGEPPKDKPLTDEQRTQRIRKLQEEQERRLHWSLGDELYDWLGSFDNDLDFFNLEK